MSNRHLSRTLVLQSLFEWDFRSLEDSKVDEILLYDIKEFSAGVSDLEFAKNLLHNVLKKRETIDNIIEKAAPQWPIEKISIMDRNVLRMGIFELLYTDRKEIPPKVAINEAIELAKSFGGENSGRFIAGVLGTIYKELGEPEKDQVSKKKNKIKDIPFEDMLVEQKCGAVPYAIHKKNIYIALVHDVFGHWTLPKGSALEKEDVKVCAERKTKQETGLDVEVGEKLGENEYIAYDPEKGKIRRQVTYFLAEGKYQPLVLEEGDDAGGLDQIKWFKLNEIGDLNFYDDILPIITKAIEILKKKKLT